MILVTGGAGFIGSNLVAALVGSGEEVVVCDRLREGEKWRNLSHHPPAELVAPEDLLTWLASGPPLTALCHLGAISATTATDGDLVWRTNVTLSQQLWTRCAVSAVPFIYASSAATYGDGSAGFADGIEGLAQLRPLNLYGWSKHVFDLWVARRLTLGAPRPPQWAGLKFFNVYGPNEYHKGGMISVVKVKYDEVVRGDRPRLFRSDRPGIADGAQARDFVWVGDAVAIVLWLLANPGVSGLFNVGTAEARSYLDIARAVCRAAGRAEDVEFVEMPDELRGRYQYFTQASMRALREAGYASSFTPLEEGVARYADILARDDPYV